MGTNNCLVFQNILIFVQHKKQPYTGLERYNGEYVMTIFLFLGKLFLLRIC